MTTDKITVLCQPEFKVKNNQFKGTVRSSAFHRKYLYCTRGGQFSKFYRNVINITSFILM